MSRPAPAFQGTWKTSKNNGQNSLFWSSNVFFHWVVGLGFGFEVSDTTAMVLQYQIKPAFLLGSYSSLSIFFFYAIYLFLRPTVGFSPVIVHGFTGFLHLIRDINAVLSRARACTTVPIREEFPLVDLFPFFLITLKDNRYFITQVSFRVDFVYI